MKRTKEDILKSKTIPQLKKTLWRWFSEFIRLRDSDYRGYCQCISCEKWVKNGSGQLHAGHYYARGNTWASLYYDEKNVNGQCGHCNTYCEGNKQGYRDGLIRKYGASVIDYLDIKKNNKVEWFRVFLEILIEDYKVKVKNLRRVNG